MCDEMRPLTPSVTHKTTHRVFKLYINGVLHLSLRTAELIGVQSWKEFNSYRIEYNLGSVEILSEYSDRNLWEAVLQIIDRELTSW